MSLQSCITGPWKDYDKHGRFLVTGKTETPDPGRERGPEQLQNGHHNVSEELMEQKESSWIPYLRHMMDSRWLATNLINTNFKRENSEPLNSFLWWDGQLCSWWESTAYNLPCLCYTFQRNSESSRRANASPMSGTEYHQVTKLVEEDQLWRKKEQWSSSALLGCISKWGQQNAGSDSSVHSTRDCIWGIVFSQKNILSILFL